MVTPDTTPNTTVTPDNTTAPEVTPDNTPAGSEESDNGLAVILLIVGLVIGGAIGAGAMFFVGKKKNAK